MKHSLLLFVFIFYFFSVFAQPAACDFSLPYTRTKAKSSLSFSSDFSFSSNAITYEFAKSHYLNRFITDELKDGVSDNLDDRNRMGSELYNEIYFRNQPDSMFGRKDWAWFIGFKDVNHLNSTFTRDLFEVYFRGNNNYAGKKAEFAEFNYQLLKFQQFLFGISKSTAKKNRVVEAGGAIGFNIGQQLLRIESAKADLYTADMGEYLDVNADVEIHNSDSLHKKIGSFNGYGFSADLFYKAEIRRKHYFFARISNLGFIRWNEKSTMLKADTSFRFEGIEVSNLFDFADTIQSEINIDSSIVYTYLNHRSYTSHVLFLPAKFEASYMTTLVHRKMRAGIGANYIMNADYTPLIYLMSDYTWMNNSIQVNVSYGGYTTFSAGLFYQHHFHRGLSFLLGTNSFPAFFNINKSTTESGFFSIRRIF